MEYSYSYAMEGMEADGFGIAMAIFWVVYMLIMMCIGIAAYALRAAGMYSIAKRRGLNNPWMAWVPVVDYYLLGCISDQYQYVSKGKVKSKRKSLLILNIIMAALAVGMIVCYVALIVQLVGNYMEPDFSDMAPLMGVAGLALPMMVIAIALAIIRYIALYDLYTSCSPQNNVLFLVLSIVFSITEPFFIFFNRKKDDGMPPRRPEPEYQPPQFDPPVM